MRGTHYRARRCRTSFLRRAGTIDDQVLLSSKSPCADCAFSEQDSADERKFPRAKRKFFGNKIGPAVVSKEERGSRRAETRASIGAERSYRGEMDISFPGAL